MQNSMIIILYMALKQKLCEKLEDNKRGRVLITVTDHDHSISSIPTYFIVRPISRCFLS